MKNRRRDPSVFLLYTVYNEKLIFLIEARRGLVLKEGNGINQELKAIVTGICGCMLSET